MVEAWHGCLSLGAGSDRPELIHAGVPDVETEAVEGEAKDDDIVAEDPQAEELADQAYFVDEAEDMQDCDDTPAGAAETPAGAAETHAGGVETPILAFGADTLAGGAEIPAGVDETHAGVVAPSAPVGPDPVRILTRLQALRIVYGSKAPSV